MRIAICSFGNEECETFEIYKQHKSTCDCSDKCIEKVAYLKKVEKYIVARKAYEADKE